MAKIFLSIPILNMPEFKSIHSVYQSIISCREHQVRIYVNENDSLISRVRNVHVSTFLHDYPEYDYFCSIDSDIEVINAFASNNIFNKLIAADKDFIGGLYPLKQYDKPPMCASIPMDKSIDRSNIQFNSGIIEMLWLSTGCWCIKRKVIEQMANAYPELEYVGDDSAAGKRIHGLFIPYITEYDAGNGFKFKKYLSEDWAFTERWRKIGGKVYTDTSIVLKHIGKIPYSLWNIEVCAKKKVEGPAQPVQQAQPIIASEIKKLSLNSLKQEEIPVTENKPKEVQLPPAGWDLGVIK